MIPKRLQSKMGYMEEASLRNLYILLEEFKDEKIGDTDNKSHLAIDHVLDLVGRELE